MTRYYFEYQGRAYGPFDAEKIRAHLRNGNLTLSSRVSKDKNVWKTIAEWPEIYQEPAKEPERPQVQPQPQQYNQQPQNISQPQQYVSQAYGQQPQQYVQPVPYGQQQYAQQNLYGQQPQQYVQQTQYIGDPSWPVKSRAVAAVLAALLGGIGAHKFYLGKWGWGLLYLAFCWTYVPSVLALIDFVLLICRSEEDFMQRYHVIIRK